jgi:hypothetical protein
LKAEASGISLCTKEVLMNAFPPIRRCVLLVLAAAMTLSGAAGALVATCGPFVDTADDAFCPLILEIFYLGITTGTSATTFDPASDVNRTQMAAFLSRTVDTALKHGSRRAALSQLWTPQSASLLGLTTVGDGPLLVQSDGVDLWVANNSSGTVSRVRGNDARLLENRTGAAFAFGVLVAMNRVIVTGSQNPGQLYSIDPSQPAGAVTTVATNLGNFPDGIAFDGAHVWTANEGGPVGTVSVVTPGASIPWTVTTVTVGTTGTIPTGALFDGNSIWVTDRGLNTLLKLGGAGSVLQTVTVGTHPFFPVFDGTNIWVPNAGSNTVTVVRASSGAVLQTLTGNGMNLPSSAAFDGERVLVTSAGHVLSLWKSADLSPVGFVPTSTEPFGACSDGIRFWVTLDLSSQLAHF